MNRKRGRNEDEEEEREQRDGAPAGVESVLDKIEQCAWREAAADAKISALKSLVLLVDPTDDSYEVQRRSERVLDAIAALLHDASPAVRVAACRALAAVADHAGVVADRISSAHIFATPERVPLNPVQTLAGSQDGVFRCALFFCFAWVSSQSVMPKRGGVECVRAGRGVCRCRISTDLLL